MAHVQMLRAIGVMWACRWLSSDDISGNQKCHKNFNYEFTSQTWFATLMQATCLFLNGFDRKDAIFVIVALQVMLQ